MSEKSRTVSREERELLQLLESRKRLPLKALRRKAIAAFNQDNDGLVSQFLTPEKQDLVFSVHKEV